MEPKGGVMRLDNGGRDHQPRKEGDLQKWEKARKQALPEAFGRDAALIKP